MTDFATVNFIRDREVQDDPYRYFAWVREQNPVWQEPKYGVFMVTGYDEAMEVLSTRAASFTRVKNLLTFCTSCSSSAGALA